MLLSRRQRHRTAAPGGARGDAGGRWTVTGNPSSVHAAGRAARRILEDAREIAGGPVRRPASRPRLHLRRHRGRCAGDPRAWAPAGALIIGATEHDAVRSAAPARRSCRSTATASPTSTPWPRCWRMAPPALVCLMLANNETGRVQPVAEAAALCRRHGALLHVDAVQAAGRIAGRAVGIGAHSLAISSHKLGGPPGAGALAAGARTSGHSPPLIAGGGQERGRRGGTPPLPRDRRFRRRGRRRSPAMPRTWRRCATPSRRAAIALRRRRVRRRRRAACRTPPAWHCPACAPTRR